MLAALDDEALDPAAVRALARLQGALDAIRAVEAGHVGGAA